MALRPDRDIRLDEIRFTCPVAASEGDILVFDTSASGAGTHGEARGSVTKQTTPSGYKVAGMVLHDVVDIDQTQYHRNWHNSESVINEPVCLAKQGWVTISNVIGTPTVGNKAYLGSSGRSAVTPSVAGGEIANPVIGQFETIKDEDGYCAVRLDIPNF
jgi:hypothetical protein